MIRNLLIVFFAAVLSLTSYCADKATGIPIWIDPEIAAKDAPLFSLQGEYIGKLDGKPVGIQAAGMKDDKLLVLTYQGGLPNEGWDGGKLQSEVMEPKVFRAMIEGFEKVQRQSPTLGKKAPANAKIHFSGEPNETVSGDIRDGLLWAGSQTAVPVKDFELHIEFRLPYKPGRTPSSQDRGNSGLYLFNNYEIQVLDSFGLDFDKENNAIKLESDSKQWCGCFYKFKQPDVPMALPPLTWQTYDIHFTAPRFEEDKKVANARITVYHNGVLIHDDVEMAKGTGAGGKRPEKSEGLIHLQGHGNPVAFRNLWVVEKP